jgi:hypothetical protein
MSSVCCPSAVFLFLGPCLQFLSRAYMTHSTENFVIEKSTNKTYFYFLCHPICRRLQREGVICTVIERFLLPDLVRVAQLRASGNSSYWYIVNVLKNTFTQTGGQYSGTFVPSLCVPKTNLSQLSLS